MKVNSLKEFKKKEKELEKKVEEWTREYFEMQLFNKYVPGFIKFLMIKSPWLRNRLSYEINNVDGDYNKLVISRKTLFRQKNKLLGKTF